jgi:gliding motility-associated-like protein
MKGAGLFFLLALFVKLHGQPFECDGRLHLLVRSDYSKSSVLYSYEEIDGQWKVKETPLSERRRLSALAYNISDNYLYSLDADTYELIRIDQAGQLFSLGRPTNIDTTLLYEAGTISTEGGAMFVISYDKNFKANRGFYRLNIGSTGSMGGGFGVTSTYPSSVGDFATDPIYGTLYGYDNTNRVLVQIGGGGNISSLNLPSNEVGDIKAVFFDRVGQMFGYSAAGAMYSIDKGTGKASNLFTAPKGDDADGCSCPYTYTFTKEVLPTTILQCDTFEVRYFFNNHLGNGQDFITLKDSFPEGFTILDFKSDIINLTKNVLTKPNKLEVNNIIYLMNDNTITLKVKAPDNYRGTFLSSAVQYPFPLAFGPQQFSDDPSTVEAEDPTEAKVISAQELELSNYISFNCTGDTAIIRSPLPMGENLWGDGSRDTLLRVTQTGPIELTAFSNCEAYYGQFILDKFPDPPSIAIVGPDEVLGGVAYPFEVKWSEFEPVEFDWSAEEFAVNCDSCHSVEMALSQDQLLKIRLVNEEGCVIQIEKEVKVSINRLVYAPNAFSPNEDGINDWFYLQGEGYGSFELTVQDRWGNELFATTDGQLNQPESGWDGKNNGKVVSSGLYIWTAKIIFADGAEVSTRGVINVM